MPHVNTSGKQETQAVQLASPLGNVALSMNWVDCSVDHVEVDGLVGEKRKSEISHWAEYDYVLVNDDLDDCFASLCTILRATRLRRDSRPDLIGHVAQLNKEFKGS